MAPKRITRKERMAIKQKLHDLAVIVSTDEMFETDYQSPLMKKYDALRSEAEKDGYLVTFTGIYGVGTAEKPENEIITPFFVAQTIEQAAELSSGKLVGEIYELNRRASVHGVISPLELKFVKKYTAQTGDPIMEIIAGALAESLHPGSSQLNPHDIKYSGRYNPKNDQYEGKWAFESNGYSPIATTGHFSLKKV